MDDGLNPNNEKTMDIESKDENNTIATNGTVVPTNESKEEPKLSKTTTINNESSNDEEQYLPTNITTNTVKENDYIFLQFNDGKQMFTQATSNPKNNKIALKINKRSYPTSSLIGLAYGCVLEIRHGKFVTLEYNEDLFPDIKGSYFDEGDDEEYEMENEESNAKEKKLDNRNLLDNNTAQQTCSKTVSKLKQDPSLTGQDIINHLIQNSSTYSTKTNFAKMKYILRKQKKHQLRFRVLQTTTPVITQAMYTKDARKVCNVRDDTLAMILSFGNVYAGCSVLVFETGMGLITGALARRMGGYGSITSIYTTQQQPGYIDFLNRFNFDFCEWESIHWLNCNYIFHNIPLTEEEEEAKERDEISWPPPIQAHTREYLHTVSDQNDQYNFLLKRAKRFTRKLTRPTQIEILQKLQQNQVTTLILSLSANYDPIPLFQKMFVYLKPSCTFILSCDYIEPLCLLFQYIKEENIALNLRLVDTWYREFSVHENRTHPVMNTSQSGAYILTGIKLADGSGGVEDEEEEKRKMELLKEEFKRHRKNSREGKRKRKRLEKEMRDGNGESGKIVKMDDDGKSENE